MANAVDKKPFQFKGVHFLVIILAFFGVVIGVNIYMASLALGTFDGLAAKDPYQRGRDYNETLDQARTQAALGWDVRFSTSTTHSTPQSTTQANTLDLMVQISDADGDALSDMTVSVLVKRPARDDLDFTLDMQMQSAGVYTASTPLPLAGRWQLTMLASRDGDIYRIDEEIFLHDGAP